MKKIIYLMMCFLAKRDFRQNKPARKLTNKTYLAIYGNCYAIAESQAHYTGDL